MTKLQQLVETATKCSDDKELYYETIKKINDEIDQIKNVIKEKVTPLEELDLNELRGVKIFEPGFLTSIVKKYDLKMREVLDILEENNIKISIELIGEHNEMWVFGEFIGTTEENRVQFYELNIDPYNLIFDLFEYLNIYPIIIFVSINDLLFENPDLVAFILYPKR